MPIAMSTKPIDKPTVEPVSVYSDDYQSTVVDTTETPIASIITYVEGSPWTVDWYSQVVAKDEELKPLDVNLSPTLQQYTKVADLVLKVTAGLTSAQNQQSKQFTLTGTATLYPFVVPNVGDMFTSDVGNGRLGLFTVTLAEQKTILKETCYSIEYGLVALLTDDLLTNLTAKTIRTVYFKAERASVELNPVLVEADALTLDRLRQLRKSLIAEYISEFYSLEFKTLVVPEQTLNVYDPFAVELFMRSTDVLDHPTIRRIRELNMDGTVVADALTWVDGLLNLTQSYFTNSFQNVKLARTGWFDFIPALDGINYSGFDAIVYPDTITTTYEQQSYRKPTLIDVLNRKSVVPTHTEFGAIGVDGRYVFSGAFYNNDHDGTTLEIMIRKMLNQERFDAVPLMTLINTIRQAGPLDRYYYLPIVLMIMRYVSIKL